MSRAKPPTVSVAPIELYAVFEILSTPQPQPKSKNHQLRKSQTVGGGLDRPEPVTHPTT